MLCYDVATYALVEIPDAQLELWRTAENPKLAAYLPVPEKPAENAVWAVGGWSIPEVPTPTTVSARQIRLWLIRHGIALSAVDAAIDGIEDATTRESVRVEWEYAPYVERTHPWLVPLAESLGLTTEQIDAAFIEAATI